MAWIVENRRTAIFEEREQPYLTDEMKRHLEQDYFPRYPTKRAVLLPALHLVQHTHNWIPTAALQEVAEFLQLAPAEVLDTATFYEEYWLRPKGKYLLGVCRSLACEICGHENLTEHLKRTLNVELGETTADGRFTLIEMECLGACGTAPVALVNDVLHEELTLEKLDRIIAGLPQDPHDYKDPTVNWETAESH
jgi:NADH-quinone oxidoreductase subunit E